MKPGSVNLPVASAVIKPGSVSIPVASGRVVRPSLGATSASATRPSSVVIAPGTAQPSPAAQVTRVVSNQAASQGTVVYPGHARTIISKPATSTAASSAAPSTTTPNVVTIRTVQASGAALPVGTTAGISTSAPAVRTIQASPLSSPQPVGTIRSVQAAPSTPCISTVRTVQASPIIRTQATSQAPRTTQAASAVRTIAVSGPTYTQGAYEAKHQHDDPQLKSLKDLRRTSGLKEVPVAEGLNALKQCSQDGQLTREQFMVEYEAILNRHGVEVPSEDVRNSVWDLFDRDGNHVVDMLELVCGISLLCAGTEDEKIHAVFDVFDENGDGYISMNEMFKFLTSVFKVVLTPNVLGVMNSMGVNVESAEDLASVTALECFKSADLNHDGKLSVTEFKEWFFLPRNDPTSLFSPARKLLA